MIFARNLFFIGALFTVVVLFLALLPIEPWEHTPKSYPVYKPYEDIHEEIVNFMIDESFSFAIKKVQFNPESLAVDFIIENRSPSLEEMYSDIYKLIRDGFTQFTTVTDIRSRMLLQNEKGERLIFAVLAMRKPYESNPLGENPHMEEIMDYINQNFIVTHGPAWLHIQE